jgi:hypothetical protein
VRLADKDLFCEGEAVGDTALAQNGRRTTRLDMPSPQDIADRERTSLATVRLAFLKNDVGIRPAGSYPGRPRRR